LKALVRVRAGISVHSVDLGDKAVIGGAIIALLSVLELINHAVDGSSVVTGSRAGDVDGEIDERAHELADEVDGNGELGLDGSLDS
jgi:hypothetical protein